MQKNNHKSITNLQTATENFSKLTTEEKQVILGYLKCLLSGQEPPSGFHDLTSYTT